MPNKNDEVWTVDMLAEYWKVHPKVIREMLANEELKGFKVRMSWRIRLSEIERYEQEQNPVGQKRRGATIGPMPTPIVTEIR